MAQELKEPGAAYVSFATFMSAVKALESALPDVIDRSIWTHLSGPTQYETFRAFRFLGLVNEEGDVQPLLRKLVLEPDGRPSVLHDIIEARYPSVVTLARLGGSLNQLNAAIEQLGVKGATVRKAIAFYMGAADYAKAPVSPHWPGAKRHRSRGSTITRRRTSTNAGKGKLALTVMAHEQTGQAAVKLVSGGTVTLGTAVDLLKLSKDDRDWVIALIDLFRSYPTAIEPDDGG